MMIAFRKTCAQTPPSAQEQEPPAKLSGDLAVCPICPRHCKLADGQLGACRGRIGRDGAVVAENYGRLTGLSLDAVEKKPLSMFHPKSVVLSLGSYGCNLACPFCQNHDISQATASTVPWRQYTPEQLVDRALELVPRGNIGLAFTYNEPFISYEFVMDTAPLAHDAGLLNVMVTNGMVEDEPLRALLPHIDAFNIDLKCFSKEGYEQLGGGPAGFDCVKNTIEQCAQIAHVEVTTLVIPGFNDTDEEMDALAGWIESIDPEIPLHISRFFPRYKWNRVPATPLDRIRKLVGVAQMHLPYVYTGNC